MQSHMGSRSYARHKRSAVPINTESIRSQRRDSRTEPARKGDGRKLFQLCACALIFLSVFAVKTFFPDGAVFLREKLVSNIEQGADYREVFSAIGKAIGSGEGVAEAFKNIYGEFFERDTSKPEGGEPEANDAAPEDAGAGGETDIISDMPGEQAVIAPGLIDEEKEEIAAAARQVMSMRNAALASRGFGLDEMLAVLPGPSPSKDTSESPENENTDAGDMPPVPDVVRMEYVELDIESTVPLKGKQSSEFGFRDHPIDGEYKFHYGLDIIGPMGASIVSYAAGEVYEVGYNNTYGNYVRVKHKDGITTFYAHCSKIFVKNGQKVKLGEKVAAVGQSGQTTGPHLHFEIRKDGKLIDPSYYI